MTAVADFVRAHGWQVVAEEPGRVTLALPATEMVRAMCRLRRALANDGVFLHEAAPPFSRPCAWAEYDGATLRARIHLMLTDDQLHGAC